jgi:hypothetical protein
MIFCTTITDEGSGECWVCSFDSNGAAIAKRQFASKDAAHAALRYAGFAEFNGSWVPVVLGPNYAAVSVVGVERIRQRRLLEFGGGSLVLDIVEAPRGYAFKFGFDILGLDQRRDPVVEILTNGLINVEAIGSWATVDAAMDCGLAFYKRVTELIPQEVLIAFLKLIKERWLWQKKKLVAAQQNASSSSS